MNSQGYFLSVGMVGSPCSPRDSQESSPAPQFKSISSLALSFLYSATLTSVYDYWKTVVLTIWTFVGKLMSLFFNRLCRFVRAFLARRKCLLISWLLSPSAVLLELKKRKSVTASTFPPSICHEVMRPDAKIFIFLNVEFQASFFILLFTHIKRLFSSSSLSAIRVVSPVFLRLLIFSQQSWLQLVIHPAWQFTWCTLHGS